MKYIFILLITIALSQLIIQSAHSSPTLLQGTAKLDVPIIETQPIDLQIEGNAILINQGNTLLAFTEDQNILTTHCTVTIKRGAIVFICVDGDYTAIYNLAEEYKQSVCVHFDDRTIYIAAGQLVVTDNVHNPVSPEELVNWRRRVIDNAATSGWWVDIGNFSITQAIGKIRVVNNLTKSDNVKDQMMIAKIRLSALKNDARNYKAGGLNY